MAGPQSVSVSFNPLTGISSILTGRHQRREGTKMDRFNPLTGISSILTFKDKRILDAVEARFNPLTGISSILTRESCGAVAQ